MHLNLQFKYSSNAFFSTVAEFVFSNLTWLSLKWLLQSIPINQTWIIPGSVPHLCVCVFMSQSFSSTCSASVQLSVGLLFFCTLSEMCLQPHSAHAVLCVPFLARLQTNYICPKVKEDTVAFASVLAPWVILPKQKGAAPPSHRYWLRDIMLRMKHENPLHHSRICKEIIFWGGKNPLLKLFVFPPPWFFLCFLLILFMHGLLLLSFLKICPLNKF